MKRFQGRLTHEFNNTPFLGLSAVVDVAGGVADGSRLEGGLGRVGKG